MPPDSDPAASTLVAFADHQRIAAGSRDAVLQALRGHATQTNVIVFNAANGERVELDLRSEAFATAVDAAPADEPPVRGVGRPKLGVVAREVTLLPRHWDWLSRQPGGASVALRRLIDEARRTYAERDTVRAAREAAYRAMSVLASELPGFEEAARSLFAGDAARFDHYVSDWPADVAAFLRQLAAGGWSPSATAEAAES